MLKIGHRGAAHAPENTLAAFEKARALGADGVELDVQRSSDGALVVLHDDTVDRTTNDAGPVAQMTLAALRALHVPTLEEALAAMAGAYCFIEVKHADAALPTAELILRHDAKRLWLISFDHMALQKARAAYPSLNIGASFEMLPLSSLEEVRAWGAQAVIPHHAALTHAHVEEAHALGLKVVCWTVNEPRDIARMKSMGVDGIISDYPERL